MSILKKSQKAGAAAAGSEIPRTLQVKCIYSVDQFDFQEEVNGWLRKLGSDVVDMDMSPSLLPGFSCVITYWGGELDE